MSAHSIEGGIEKVTVRVLAHPGESGRIGLIYNSHGVAGFDIKDPLPHKGSIKRAVAQVSGTLRSVRRHYEFVL